MPHRGDVLSLLTLTKHIRASIAQIKAFRPDGSSIPEITCDNIGHQTRGCMAVNMCVLSCLRSPLLVAQWQLTPGQQHTHTHTCRDAVEKGPFERQTHTLVLSSFARKHTHTCLSEGFTRVTHATLNTPIRWESSCLCLSASRLHSSRN